MTFLSCFCFGLSFFRKSSAERSLPWWNTLCATWISWDFLGLSKEDGESLKQIESISCFPLSRINLHLPTKTFLVTLASADANQKVQLFRQYGSIKDTSVAPPWRIFLHFATTTALSVWMRQQWFFPVQGVSLS